MGDNIKIDLKEVGWEGVPWFELAQYRDKCWAVVNVIMKSAFRKMSVYVARTGAITLSGCVLLQGVSCCNTRFSNTGNSLHLQLFVGNSTPNALLRKQYKLSHKEKLLSLRY
jgi:hypothetical protein